jgi:hypothetical protein
MVSSTATSIHPGSGAEVRHVLSGCCAIMSTGATLIARDSRQLHKSVTQQRRPEPRCTWQPRARQAVLDIDPCKAVLNRAQASGHTAQRRQQGNRMRFSAADPSYVTHSGLITVSLCAARHLSRSVPRDRHCPLLSFEQSLCDETVF